jgi:hypothetical protein
MARRIGHRHSSRWLGTNAVRLAESRPLERFLILAVVSRAEIVGSMRFLTVQKEEVAILVCEMSANLVDVIQGEVVGRTWRKHVSTVVTAPEQEVVEVLIQQFTSKPTDTTYAEGSNRASGSLRQSCFLLGVGLLCRPPFSLIPRVARVAGLHGCSSPRQAR